VVLRESTDAILYIVSVSRVVYILVVGIRCSMRESALTVINVRGQVLEVLCHVSPILRS
jgi:hypothetical protein